MTGIAAGAAVGILAGLVLAGIISGRRIKGYEARALEAERRRDELIETVAMRTDQRRAHGTIANITARPSVDPAKWFEVSFFLRADDPIAFLRERLDLPADWGR